MSLDTLMGILRQNTGRIEERRRQAQAVLSSAAAQMGGGGGGGGNYGSFRGSGSFGGGGKGGKLFGGKWPAKGERHKHGGYSWTKWAGDINVPGSGDLGNPVLAYNRGRVASVQHLKNSYGSNIVIRHPNGTRTRYAHLSATGVRPGQRVKRGQRIGKVGQTGNASGPHLHFEIF